MSDKIELLLADYCAGTISGHDMEELREWIEASIQNRRQFMEYLKAHQVVMETKLLRGHDEEKAWHRLQHRLEHKPHARVRRLLIAAAIAAVMIGIAPAFWGIVNFGDGESVENVLPGGTKATLLLTDGSTIQLDQYSEMNVSGVNGIVIRHDTTQSVVYTPGNEPEINLHTIHVPRGGEFDFTLPDGTHIWLNSDSNLQFPTRFSDDLREVYLEGEAYLTVSKNPERPFVVNTNYGSVNVLGTTFNVSAYPEDKRMVTSLLEGSVEVSVDDRSALLIPGRQAVWEEGWQEIQVRATDLSSAFSWVKGEFEFEDLPLAKILSYLSRWYDVTFEFSSPDIADLRFTGGARKYLPLGNFLKVIESSYDIKFVQRGSKIKVTAI